MRKKFDSFAGLPLSLQKEAIREGEKLLDAQFMAASGADQRALTWAGFLISPATGALGGGIALFNKTPADVVLGYISIGFGIALLASAWIAIETVRPGRYDFPGNRPAHWLPEEWASSGTNQHREQTARTDQAQHLDACICKNRDRAAEKARAMGSSFHLALWSAVLAGVALVIIVTARHFTIREPISEIVSLRS